MRWISANTRCYVRATIECETITLYGKSNVQGALVTYLCHQVKESMYIVRVSEREQLVWKEIEGLRVNSSCHSARRLLADGAEDRLDVYRGLCLIRW